MEKQKYTYDYPRPAVTTDCVVFAHEGDGLSVLLIQRGGEPYKGAWAFPGGFLNMDETAEQGALRELQEETGLELSNVTQVGAFTKVDRDPRSRVITIAFYAITEKRDVKGGDDAARAQWFPLDQLPKLAFDHDDVLREAMEKMRRDAFFSKSAELTQTQP
jgi:8-oxo-dGTP diphosphatase